MTRVEELDADTRQEEIARMLSGSIVTAEARAAAASLIAGARRDDAPAAVPPCVLRDAPCAALLRMRRFVMALRQVLILRSARSGRLEGRSA